MYHGARTWGNMLDDGFHDYLYDAENRIIKVDNGSTAVYTYDAEGERVRKVAARLWITSTTTPDARSWKCRLPAPGAARSYTWAGGIWQLRGRGELFPQLQLAGHRAGANESGG